MYQINGEDHIRQWMRDRPADEILAMLEWLPRLAADPHESARAVRRNTPGVPAFTAMVPGTTAFVDYTVVDQYHTVMILGCNNLGLEDLVDPGDPQLPGTEGPD